MSQILPEISLAATGADNQQKLDALVRQLNEWGRLITNAVVTQRGESAVRMNYWFGSYKLNSAWTNLNGSLVEIDFDNWSGHNWYWECVIFTDAGTGHARLYNVTDDEPVDNTEFTTTAVGEANAEYNRTGVLTKPTGVKQFRTQVRITGGDGSSEYVNCVSSSMVFKIEPD